MPEMSFRLRLVLFFALLALAVPAVVGGAAWLADAMVAEKGPQVLGTALFLAAGGASVVLVVLIVGVALLFDIHVASPIQGLVRDLETLVHARPGHRIEIERARYLGKLPAAVRRLADELTAARAETERRIDEATGATQEQKARLEAVLNDLHAGVIICNLGHQILLYNQCALALLRLSGSLGLGRSLFSVLNRQPFLHALERLTNRLADGRERTHPDGLTARFVCATGDGRNLLEGRMGLVVDRDGRATSYVLTLEDITADLADLGARDRLLRAATQGLRYPVANLLAAAEALADFPDMEAGERAEFARIVAEEGERLTGRLDQLSADYEQVITGHWPMADVYSANLLNCVVRRLREDKDTEAVMTGLPQWMHGDSHSLVELLDDLIYRVKGVTGADSFDLEAEPGERTVYLNINWRGAPVPPAAIEGWLDSPLEDAPGGLTLRDVLDHHRAELWSESIAREGGGDWARLRMPMPLPKRAHMDTGGDQDLPARPEFYDFAILERPTGLGARGGMALGDLTFVVFDTETTGLQPSKGDRIISIAGVRIVNGRILTGESFSQLVNPGRPIPRGSIRFHGITDEMVAEAPPIEVVLPQFHDFVQGAVLVAHNAAFDVKFLKILEEETGLAFDMPVLDTLLLSVYLHRHTNQHSLDDCAARFGVPIQGRHTALGDALVTAEVFQRMVALLADTGVETLDQALAAAHSIVEVRKQQEQF
ncbi:MAG: 3'-5' exonuclease [Hyphomicrobiales bacterium]|nr:3'-5' exonuclease [Hyphomicrobiales bacterium]